MLRKPSRQYAKMVTVNNSRTPAEIVDEVMRSFREHGGRHYGEQVTELEHALQCATFARDNGEPPELIAACLLHDYGHLCHDLGENIADEDVDARHEGIGAKWLRQFFCR